MEGWGVQEVMLFSLLSMAVRRPSLITRYYGFAFEEIVLRRQGLESYTSHTYGIMGKRDANSFLVVISIDFGSDLHSYLVSTFADDSHSQYWHLYSPLHSLVVSQASCQDARAKRFYQLESHCITLHLLRIMQRI